MTKKILPIAFVVLAIILTFHFTQKPQNDRNWTDDQKILASAEITENTIHIKNIRNNTYRSESDFDVAYYDKTFDLSRIASVDYVVVPLADWRGPAHTQLSFGFDTNNGTREYIAISVEIRKEVGESFSPFKGLFRNYELIYVVADENDVIKLRTNHRDNNVFLYPIKAEPELIKKVFLSVIDEVNQLKTTPKFYNTFSNSCATNIAKHVNLIKPGRIPFSYKVILPGYSDELAYDLGLIDTTVSLEDLRKTHSISEKARSLLETDNFSTGIRK